MYCIVIEGDVMRAKFFIFSICCALLMAGATPCEGQNPAPTPLSQTASMPPWIVPVLRLVSATHVEPTTGVVISATGLVLVAHNFASPNDEIIVLDGGTDIVRNGRPAKIERQFPAEGLMVLSVELLKRNAFNFTAGGLTDGSTVRLQAFPPAELIEQGAPPLDVAATISFRPGHTRPTLSPDTPLPNVTGPILDACGSLAGFSSADGVQSMSIAESPRYQWKDSLVAILGKLQIKSVETPCKPVPSAAGLQQPAAEESETQTGPHTIDEPKSKPEPQPGETPADPADVSGTSDEKTNEHEAVDDEQEPEEDALNDQELPPPMEKIADPEIDLKHETPGDGDSNYRVWAWLFAVAFLLGSALVARRIRYSKSLNAENNVEAPRESAPIPLEQATSQQPAYPSPGLDSLLIIEGILSDGTEFRRSCKVSRKAINILIGRGNADINIDSPRISRQHVSLNGKLKLLTMTDLGSSNGSSINGVPCLEGETMFIEPGDIIILGNARFSYDIIPVAEA